MPCHPMLSESSGSVPAPSSFTPNTPTVADRPCTGGSSPRGNGCRTARSTSTSSSTPKALSCSTQARTEPRSPNLITSPTVRQVSSTGAWRRFTVNEDETMTAGLERLRLSRLRREDGGHLSLSSRPHRGRCRDSAGQPSGLPGRMALICTARCPKFVGCYVPTSTSQAWPGRLSPSIGSTIRPYAPSLTGTTCSAMAPLSSSQRPDIRPGRCRCSSVGRARHPSCWWVTSPMTSTHSTKGSTAVWEVDASSAEHTTVFSRFAPSTLGCRFSPRMIPRQADFSTPRHSIPSINLFCDTT